MKPLAQLPLGDTIRLTAGEATLVVAPQCGARLLHFSIAGRHILRPLREIAGKPPAPYDFAGFPLLPYSGPIFGNGFAFEGTTYPLNRNIAAEGDPVHGDAWIGNWRVEEQTTDRVVLAMNYEPRATAFPFRWSGQITYGVSPDALNIALSITNTDNRAFPAGMGFHPYFPRPSGARLQFGHGDVWPADSPEAVTVEPQPIEGLDFNDGQALDGLVVDRCFEDWPGMARIDYADGSHVTVDASREFGKMQIYVPWDDPFLCVEPVSNANDGFNRARHGVLRHGVVRLAPGQSLSGTIRIAAHGGYSAR